MSYQYDRARLPLTTHSSLPDTSCYNSVPVHGRFERFGSGIDLDLLGKSVIRSSTLLQMKFVRTVYIITLIQLVLIMLMMSILIYEELISQWLIESQYAWWIVLFPATVVMIVSAWQLWMYYYLLSKASRIVMITLYSFSMAFILSIIISKIFNRYGMLVIIMICCGVIGTILYTFQLRYLFKGLKPILCSTGMICISSISLRGIYALDPVQILGPITLAILFCLYLSLELYYSMGIMTPDDPILANISFHMDIAYPINYIHHLCELSDPIDNFPELFDPRPN